MTIDWLWLFLGFFYAIMALATGVVTARDNQTLPAHFDRPSPWLRGVLWFPVVMVGLCLIILDTIAIVAGEAFKRRR